MALVDFWNHARQPAARAAETIPLTALPVGHAWRVNGIDEARVSAVAAAMPAVPPIVVSRNDRTIVDGAHRVAAARRLGLHALEVTWFEGTPVEAYAAFVAANLENGLPLTSADRERGVARVLRSEPKWSDRRVAEVCGVSPKMVARLRLLDGPCTSATPADKRVGRDGRARPIRAGAMRDRIAEALLADPSASLRAVASVLGVSPETVRSVRMEISANPIEAFGASALGRSASDEHCLALLMQLRSGAPAAAPWRHDNAFRSTETGASFVEWFDATTVAGELDRVHEVPLSRIYEIADEARKRAAYWSDFAATIEGRIRHRS